MHHRQTDRQTDRQAERRKDESDWFYTTHKVGGSIMFFRNLRIKFGSNQYKKKEYNQHSSVLKEFEKKMILSKIEQDNLHIISMSQMYC